LVNGGIFHTLIIGKNKLAKEKIAKRLVLFLQ